MSTSDLFRHSPSNYQAIADRNVPERSSSPLSANDLARRLRSAFTPPRSRREKLLADELRPRSATASPCVGPSTSSELLSGMPPRHKTVSCGDIGRLENIFEPRLAPYTPPLKVRRGLDVSDHRSLSDEQIERLETRLFEPRDAACTPPLRRKVFACNSSAPHRQLSAQSSVSSTDGNPADEPGESRSESPFCCALSVFVFPLCLCQRCTFRLASHRSIFLLVLKHVRPLRAVFVFVFLCGSDFAASAQTLSSVLSIPTTATDMR